MSHIVKSNKYLFMKFQHQQMYMNFIYDIKIFKEVQSPSFVKFIDQNER